MRQWAIVVGLNHYQHFQPLSCAQQDAHAVHHYLIHDLGFQAERCLLLTDTSPPLWGQPTQPTRVNLLSWIELFTKTYLHPDDLVWFFFSGYGVVQEGQDYLVPGDGNPANIPSTCLAISVILERFKAVLSQGSLFFLLDMSRSQGGVSSHQSVGSQTAQVAHQLGVPTLLSCQPGQLSREVSSLGHGLFTLALLEGWRYQPGTSIAALTQFLGDRLPELCQHYWQPTQRPLLICPLEKLHQPLLPLAPVSQAAAHHSKSSSSPTPYPSTQTENHSTPTTPTIVAMAPSMEHTAAFKHQATNPLSSVSAGGVPLSGQPTVLQSATIPTTQLHDFHPAPDSLAPTRPPIEATNPSAQPDVGGRSPAFEKPEEETDPRRWRSVWVWGSLISLILAVGVLGRNWASLWSPAQFMASASNSLGAGAAPTAVPTPPIAPTQAPTDTTPLPPSTGPDGQPSEATNAPPAEATSSPAPIANPTPSPPTTLNFSPPASQLAGPVILDRARKMVQSDQATPYRDAIDEAKKIAPEDTIYSDAKAAIQDWSQMIFDIAQRRASQQQLDIAILAADKVPQDNPQLYAQARSAIAQWCPAVKSLPGDTPSQQQAKSICGF